MFMIESQQVLDELPNLVAFFLFEPELAGIGRVEGDAEKDVTGIQVFCFLFCPGEPADGAMDSYAQRFRLAVSHEAVLLFKSLGIHIPLLSMQSASRIVATARQPCSSSYRSVVVPV